MGELRNDKKRNMDFATDGRRKNRAIDYSHYMMRLRMFYHPPSISRNRGWQFIGEISNPYRLFLLRSIFHQSPVYSVQIRIRPTPLSNNYRFMRRMRSLFDSIFISIGRKTAVPSNQRSPDGYRFLGNSRAELPTTTTRSDSAIYPSRLRFIVDADLSRAFDSPGWVGAQFNNLGLSIHRATTYIPAITTSYDHRIRSKLTTLSRERTPMADYFSLLREGDYAVGRYVARSLAPMGKSQKWENGGFLY